MKVRLIDLPYRELHPMVRALSNAGFDSELAERVRRQGGGERAVAALRREFFPNDLTVALHEGRLTPEQLKAVVEGRFEIVESTMEKPEPAPAVWKTITLGLHKDAAAYLAALHAGGYLVGDYARQILAKTPIATTETVVDLVRLTLPEMGFPRGATITEIYARIRELGLQICPAEVGPALRLAHADQPLGKWIHVGMKPFVDSDGDLGVFFVAHYDGGWWLDTRCAHPSCQWDPEDVWVFVRST